MSGRSFKTQWQIALAKSGLGFGPVGTGVIMSLHARADGSGVWPSMPIEADRIGCSRDTLEGHRKTLVTRGWLTFAAKAVPNHRGVEYRLTIPEVDAGIPRIHPTEMDAGFSEVDAGFSAMDAGIPCTNMIEEHDTPEHDKKNMSLDHEEHHGCTGLGEHAWCGIEANPPVRGKAKAALAEEMERAPSFD